MELERVQLNYSIVFFMTAGINISFCRPRPVYGGGCTVNPGTDKILPDLRKAKVLKNNYYKET